MWAATVMIRTAHVYAHRDGLLASQQLIRGESQSRTWTWSPTVTPGPIFQPKLQILNFREIPPAFLSWQAITKFIMWQSELEVAVIRLQCLLRAVAFISSFKKHWTAMSKSPRKGHNSRLFFPFPSCFSPFCGQSQWFKSWNFNSSLDFPAGARAILGAAAGWGSRAIPLEELQTAPGIAHSHAGGVSRWQAFQWRQALAFWVCTWFWKQLSLGLQRNTRIWGVETAFCCIPKKHTSSNFPHGPPSPIVFFLRANFLQPISLLPFSGRICLPLCTFQ